MIRDKQIEEMAKDFCALNMPCEECHLYKNRCCAKKYATRAYNAGYRKSTDVAEEIFAEIEDRAEGEWLCDDGDDEYLCSNCRQVAPLSIRQLHEVQSAYCPWCGAKMKGENDEQR